MNHYLFALVEIQELFDGYMTKKTITDKFCIFQKFSSKDYAKLELDNLMQNFRNESFDGNYPLYHSILSATIIPEGDFYLLDNLAEGGFSVEDVIQMTQDTNKKDL